MSSPFMLPFVPALGLTGGIAAAATLTFYATGTTTLAPIFDDDGDALPNPITADAFGRFADIYLDDTVTYRVILKTALGVTLGDIDPIRAGLGDFTQDATGAVGRPIEDKLRDIVDLRDFGIPADGTDQTAAIVAKLSALAADDWEGTIHLPMEMRADMQQVVEALPPKAVLKFDIVFQEGAGYRQQMTGIADSPPLDANTDTAFTVITRHYGDVHLNNLGNDETESGLVRRVGTSWGRGFFRHGRRGPRAQWQTNFERSPVRTGDYDGAGVSCFKVVTRAPWRAGDYEEWGLNITTEAGRYYVVDNGRFYKALTSAVSTVKPVFTSGTQTVGGVQWEFVSQWIGFRTCFYIDELGRIGSNQVTTGTTQLWDQNPEDAEDFNVRYHANGPSKLIRFHFKPTDAAGAQLAMPYLEAAEGTGVRMVAPNSAVLWACTQAGGMQLGANGKLSYPATNNSTTPNVEGVGRLVVSNSGATSITGFPGFYSGQEVELYFTNSNTTLVHSGTLSLKGAVNVNPGNGSIIVLTRDPTNAAWVEKSRNF